MNHSNAKPKGCGGGAEGMVDRAGLRSEKQEAISEVPSKYALLLETLNLENLEKRTAAPCSGSRRTSAESEVGMATPVRAGQESG